MMPTQLVQSKGPFLALPVFPDSLQGLTAVVAGASGISGTYMLKVLAESPKRWTKVYALSRRPPEGEWPSHFQHISVDFLNGGPEGIAKALADHNVKMDVVFFYTYIQPAPIEGGGIWSNIQELVRVNTTLLDNFLEALPLANAVPKRILLQLGAKYYGVHLGPSPAPQEEDDPRVDIEPNFYYPQEDILMEFCKKHDIGWNTTHPSYIPGAVRDAAMNMCLPLAIYATVQKRLGKPIDFPADLVPWEVPNDMSSARMNSYIAEWAVLTEAAKNERLNSVDGSPFSWGKFWPKMAKWFSMDYGRPETGPGAKFHELTMPYDPPPRGFGGPAVMRFKFTLAQWAKQPEVLETWKVIAQEHDLANKELLDIDRIFGFTDYALMTSYPVNLSSAKLRKLGFYGYVDSAESIHQVFNEFVELRMIPKFE